jgi:hypothetical protein
LTVELAPEAVLTGVVRDAAGAPVKAFYVNLMSGGDQVSARGRPDDKGRFRVTELPAGAWTVMVRDADGRSMLYRGQAVLKAGETKDLVIEAKNQ